MDLTFNVCNSLAKTGLIMALHRFLTDDRPPVALCIGSDLVIGDSLGPVCGTLLQERCRALLEADGFSVYVNEQVPGNDGGICLGQAWIALQD